MTAFSGFYGGHTWFKIKWPLSVLFSAQLNRPYLKNGIAQQDQLSGLNDTNAILVFNLGWQPYWILGHVTSELILKCTREEIILENMEMDTKINFLVSIIPMLCLCFILALLGGGHIGY